MATSASHASPSHASASHASPSHTSASHASPSHASPSHASHASASHASASHASPSHASPSHASASHASASHASHASASHASHASPSRAASSQRPVKGILKNKSSMMGSFLAPSVMQQQKSKSADLLSKKSQRWDEMNILATYYIADEDEDKIKADQPKSPTNSAEGEYALHEPETTSALTAGVLAEKLAIAEGSEPKYLVHEQESSGDEDNGFSCAGKRSLLSACCLFFFKCSVGKEQGEEKTQLRRTRRSASERRLQFEMKRKLHDTELNIKLARQLVSKELLAIKEDEETSKAAAGEGMKTEESNQRSTKGDQRQNKSQRS